jgi:hypothetical protein
MIERHQGGDMPQMDIRITAIDAENNKVLVEVAGTKTWLDVGGAIGLHLPDEIQMSDVQLT